MCQARFTCTRIRSLTPWLRRSTRQIVAGLSRSRTTRNVAWIRNLCARRSQTSPTSSRVKMQTPRSFGRLGAKPLTGTGSGSDMRSRTKQSTDSLPVDSDGLPAKDLVDLITRLTEQMHTAAAELQFELAARYRDEISDLEGVAANARGGSRVSVPDWVWLVTIAGFAIVIVADLLLVDSNPTFFGVKEATRWVIIYMSAAVLFGIGLYFWQGAQYAGSISWLHH